jgi:hypothetical protein
MSGCVRQTTKKYVTRKSPPFPANECKNSVKKGNDGQMYRSTPDKNRVYRWKLIVEDEEEEEDEDFDIDNIDDQEEMMDCSEGFCRVKRKPVGVSSAAVGATSAAVGAASAAVGAAVGAAGAAMGAAVGAAKVAAGVPLAAAKAVGGVAFRAAKAVPVVVKKVAEIPLGLGRVATGIAGKAVQGVTRAVERTVRAVSPLRGERVVLGETNLDVDDFVSNYVNKVNPSLLERIRRAKIGLAKRGLI